MLLASPLALDGKRGGLQLGALKVVEHDDVCAGRNGLVGLLLGADLDLNLCGKAGDSARGLDGVSDGSRRPHVVVLEHDHGGEVVSVGIRAADNHGVLFDGTQARGGLAGAGNDACVAALRGQRHNLARLGGDATGARQQVECGALRQQDPADGTRDDGDRDLVGSVSLDVLALLDLPLGGDTSLVKDLLRKGNTGKNALLLVVRVGKGCWDRR